VHAVLQFFCLFLINDSAFLFVYAYVLAVTFTVLSLLLRQIILYSCCVAFLTGHSTSLCLSVHPSVCPSVYPVLALILSIKKVRKTKIR